MRERGKYEVTVNLEWPTTEVTEIPKEWIKAKCVHCKVDLLIDKKNKIVHHKEPFCHWFKEAWVASEGRSEMLLRLVPAENFTLASQRRSLP